MISLLKYLQGPWEQVRQSLIDDLQTIESTLNARWAAVFGNDNQIKLINGVIGELPLDNIEPVSADVLIGRRTQSAGPIEAISLGSNLHLTGRDLRAVFPYGMSMGEGGGEGEMGPPGLRGADGATGATGPQGPAGGVVYNIGLDGEDGTDGLMGPQGNTGPTGPAGPQGPIGAGLTVIMNEDNSDPDPWPPFAPGAAAVTPGMSGAPVVVALVDGATPALDASLGNVFTLAAGGNRTIAVPTNPTNGQKIIIRHLASGGARTLALNTGAGGFRFGTDITALTATASGKTDYIGCIYSSIDSFWDVVAVTKGF